MATKKKEALVCTSRMKDPTGSFIKHTRKDCMNLQTYKTSEGTFTVCGVCDKWADQKQWDEGIEFDEADTPFIRVEQRKNKRIIGLTILSFVTTLPIFYWQEILRFLNGYG